MSASSKKKLRREQEAVKLTEKQLTAQKEAKKLKLYTTAFVAVLAVILVVAVTVGVKQTISSNGIMEKKTVAVTVGDHEINNVEMNYFYLDSVNNFLSSYGSYAAMFGLDTTKPLNEQVLDEESGLTWADDFLNSAKSTAQTAYALADAANAAGFTLSEDELTTLELNVSNINAYAKLYGYSDGESYLKALYGNGASTESYLEYLKLTALADAYYQSYGENLVYDEDAIRAEDAANPGSYDSYSFNSYYLAASKFLTGGTTDENGTTTYSDEEKAASYAAAEEAAKSLISADVATVADLDAAIAALSVNADTTASSTANSNVQAASINSVYGEWVTNSSRKAGDMEVFANTSTDSEGNETTLGYYVVYFNGVSDNKVALKNARHILVSFTHGEETTEDHDHNTSGYTDEEKAAAKATAEEILNEWMNGAATEESFAELANAKSNDGDGTTGGLYENIYPGQMVTNFNDWCFDESRKTGDTGIVETEYGYHVMYFVSDAELNYRDYMISSNLRNAEMNQWYADLLAEYTITDGNAKYVDMGLVVSAS